MTQFIQKHFILFIAVAMILGFIFDSLFSFLGDIALQLLMGLMLTSFIGMDFRLFFERLKKPGSYLLVFAVLKIILAAALYYAVRPFNETIAAGMLFIAAAPSAGISPALTRICHGDTEFIIGLLIFTTIISPFSLPATMNFLAGADMDINIMGMIQTMVFLIIIPFTISILAGKYLKKQVDRVRPYLSSTAVIILSTMLLGLTAHASPVIRSNLDLLPLYGGSAIALGVILSFTGYRLFFFMDRKKRIGLSLSTLYINLGLIIVLASRYFPEKVMIFTLFYMIPANFFPGIIKELTLKQTEAG